MDCIIENIKHDKPSHWTCIDFDPIMFPSSDADLIIDP